VAERIRSLVENSFIMVEDKKISVTISLGATFTRGEETLEHLVERVDGLMYKSKEQGGNRCSIG
jgi:PleD family two-component response regulator